MKSTLTLLALLLSLLVGTSAWAQADNAPVEYGERVSVGNVSRQTLHARAREWADRHFAYGPKTNFKSDPGTGALSVVGTAKLKLQDGKGKEMERATRFEFVFQSNDEGYTYSVSSFRVIPDAAKPDVLLSLDEYLTQLRADKNNERTKNDRRARAQATSLASEVALSFRSYMNSMPAVEDGSVGLSTDKDGN